jgi:hypothetical protein
MYCGFVPHELCAKACYLRTLGACQVMNFAQPDW